MYAEWNVSFVSLQVTVDIRKDQCSGNIFSAVLWEKVGGSVRNPCKNNVGSKKVSLDLFL